MLLQFIQNSRMIFVCECPIINILYYWMTNPRYYYIHLSLLFIPLANTYGYLIPFRSIVSFIHSHCPILFLLVMPSSMIVSFYLSLSRITHHVLFHIAPDRLDLLIRRLRSSSFLPRKPKHSFRLDPSTSLENCVGVNYTPSSTLFSSSTPAPALLAL